MFTVLHPATNRTHSNLIARNYQIFKVNHSYVHLQNFHALQ